MEITDIRAGMRVLYKRSSGNWLIGEIKDGNAIINRSGILLPIYTEASMRTLKSQKYILDDELQIIYVPISNVFFDAFSIEDNIKGYSDYFMTKEDYMNFVESDEFEKRGEVAYVSDGEYGYYPVSKFSRAWLEKQPFNYIVRNI